MTVTYSEDIDNQRAQIAPLLLLPLVENAFKHGANSTTGKAVINIRLILQGQQLDFRVDNTAEHVAKKENGSESGIGLKNIRRQLDLIYPEQYSLSLSHKNGLFQAALKLDLSAGT
ncbi:MAG: GHKL domain-containing protein [Lewinellaceae bacterium]|nr:GHKL domain-containing protein [Lewinellaceae bacterium]